MAITPTDFTWAIEATGTSPSATNSGQVLLITEANVDADFWLNVANGGGDIRVCEDAAGLNQLPLHVIDCDTVSETLRLRTRKPAYASADRKFYIFSKNGSDSQPAASSTFGSQNVYQDYYFWLTLDSTTVTDSAGNLSPTTSGISATRSGVFNGTALDFNGTGYIDLGASSPIPSKPYTMQALIYSDANPSGNNWIMGTDRLQDFAGGHGMWADNAGAVTSNMISADDNIPTAPRVETPDNSILGGNPYLVSFGADSVTSDFFAKINTSAKVIEASASSHVVASGRFRIGNNSGFPIGFNGAIQDARVRDEYLPDSHLLIEHANESDPATFWTMGTSYDPSAGGGYSITLDSGSYTYTGGEIQLSVNRKLAIDAGLYSYTGNNVQVSVSRSITLDSGSYSYDGFDSALSAHRKITIDAGEYVYTGNAVTLTYTPSGGGTYSITLEAGAYVYTGQSVNLAANRALSLSSGAYLYQGQSVQLSAHRSISIEGGAYVVTGNSVQLSAHRAITLEAGAYEYTGFPVTLTYSGEIIALISGYRVNYKQDDVSAGYEDDYIQAEFI
jgi:hypothetical protein